MLKEVLKAIDGELKELSVIEAKVKIDKKELKKKRSAVIKIMTPEDLEAYENEMLSAEAETEEEEEILDQSPEPVEG